MRQLFVPACLCLMTWSHTTGFDFPIDRFSGSSSFDKNVLMRAAEAGGGTRDAPPADEKGDEPPSGDETASIAADAPADVADDLRPAIDPQKIPLPPIAKPVVHRSRQEICDTLAKAAQSNALPIAYFIRLLFQESAFDAGSVSSAGAQGIAQFMPETAATEGLQNPFDPLQAIPASARLLRKLFDRFGNLGLAAAAYNAGPKRIQDWLAKKGELPQETEGYVKIVTGRPAKTWRVASAAGTALTVPRRAPCKEAVPPAPPSLARSATATNATATNAPAHGGKKLPHVAAAKPGKPSAPHQKVPIEQLAARKHKSKHTHLAQR